VTGPKGKKTKYTWQQNPKAPEGGILKGKKILVPPGCGRDACTFLFRFSPFISLYLYMDVHTLFHLAKTCGKKMK
jgi:hypothetical protein